MKKSFKKELVDFKVFFTSHYYVLDMYFQHNLELDSSGRDGKHFAQCFAVQTQPL